MTREYFAGCFTPEDVKRTYRELALKHHPDVGGDTRTMQKINAEYHLSLKMMDGRESIGTDEKKHTYKYDESKEQAIMDKIGELLGLRITGIEIALIGMWVWITGDTKPHKDALKGAGCMWHTKRKCWYWRGEGYKSYRRSKASLSELALRYGCRVFDPQEETRLATV